MRNPKQVKKSQTQHVRGSNMLLVGIDTTLAPGPGKGRKEKKKAALKHIIANPSRHPKTTSSSIMKNPQGAAAANATTDVQGKSARAG